MIEYARQYGDRLLTYSIDHLAMVFLALLLALVFVVPVLILTYRFPRLRPASVTLASILYVIPSYALFALLIPLTGLGKTTAIIGLAIYCQYVLLRNSLTGLAEVGPATREAAMVMGMTRCQVLWKIDLPMAYPSILAGLKLALTSAIGIATVAATINAGGLGELLFQGLRTQNAGIMMWGIVLAIVLCLLLSALIDTVERGLNHRFRKDM